MRRIHAPEIEDEAWCPAPLRDGMTAFLQASAEHLKTFDPARDVLMDVVHRRGVTHIVDLCSGGGGPLLSLLPRLDGIQATLTDLFPNHAAFDRAEERSSSKVRGLRSPVDAAQIPTHLQGLRTLFNALHHFRPEQARALLLDAAQKRQPLCVFEIVERHPLTLAAVLMVPLAALALIPFTRPDLLRLVLTYVVPLVPLAAGWDGVASCLRAYSLAELRALADEVQVPRYRFTVGATPRGFPGTRVLWLVGEPTDEFSGTSAVP